METREENLDEQLWRAQERDSLVTQENGALLARVAELDAATSGALTALRLARDTDPER